MGSEEGREGGSKGEGDMRLGDGGGGLGIGAKCEADGIRVLFVSALPSIDLGEMVMQRRERELIALLF